MTVKNTSAGKPLGQFTELMDVKKKNAVFRLGADKSKHKAIRSGSILWSSIPKRQGHTKINDQVKNPLRLDSTTS